MLASTLCTNPAGSPAKCNGNDVTPGKGNLNKDVIGIFRQGDESRCIADNLPKGDCPSSVADVRVYSSGDNKTFVIVPINYLGSSSEYINYTVYLGSGLLRQTGELAFPGGFERDYGWSFEVSNKIDLDPPKVRPNGVSAAG